MQGAVNGTRTRDPRLGKPMLYQLSYYRNETKMVFERVLNSEIRKRADTGTRTRDLRITNALLYQLSHIGIFKCGCKGNTFHEEIKRKRQKIFLFNICLLPRRNMETTLLHLVLNIASALLAHIVQHLGQYPFQRVVLNLSAFLTWRLNGLVTIVADIEGGTI